MASLALLACGCGGELDANEKSPSANGVDLVAPLPRDFDSLDPRANRILRALHARVSEAPYDAALRREYAATLDSIQYDLTALVVWAQAASLDPQHAGAHHHVGRLLAEAGRYEQAADAFEKAAMLDPKQASTMWRWGLCLLELDRTDEARLAFEGAQAATPNDPSGAAGLVRVALAEGDLESADALLEEVLLSYPKDNYLRDLQAKVKRRLGDEAAAALLEARGATATRCFRADPLERELSSHRVGFKEDMTRARELLAAGRPIDALDLLEPMYSEDPAHLGVEGLTVQALIALNQTERARAILNESLARGEQPQTRLSLGYVHFLRGEFEQALDSADASLAAQPKLANAHFLRAKALFAMDRREESIASLKTAFASGEKSLEAHLLLGQSLGDLKEYERAVEACTQATDAYPASLQAWAMRCEMEIRAGNRSSARRSFIEVAARDAKGLMLPKLTELIGQGE